MPTRFFVKGADDAHMHPAITGEPVAMISGENPRFPAEKQGHEALAAELDAAGFEYEPTRGRYGTPERSFIVHIKSPNHIHKLMEMGHSFGQEAIVYSNGGKQFGLYTNGPNIGLYSPGQGAPSFSYQEPQDYFTAVPTENGDAGFFTYNINWDHSMKQPVPPELGEGVTAIKGKTINENPSGGLKKSAIEAAVAVMKGAIDAYQEQLVELYRLEKAVGGGKLLPGAEKVASATTTGLPGSAPVMLPPGAKPAGVQAPTAEGLAASAHGPFKVAGAQEPTAESILAGVKQKSPDIHAAIAKLAGKAAAPGTLAAPTKAVAKIPLKQAPVPVGMQVDLEGPLPGASAPPRTVTPASFAPPPAKEAPLELDTSNLPSTHALNRGKNPHLGVRGSLGKDEMSTGFAKEETMTKMCKMCKKECGGACAGESVIKMIKREVVSAATKKATGGIKKEELAAGKVPAQGGQDGKGPHPATAALKNEIKPSPFAPGPMYDDALRWREGQHGYHVAHTSHGSYAESPHGGEVSYTPHNFDLQPEKLASVHAAIQHHATRMAQKTPLARSEAPIKLLSLLKQEAMIDLKNASDPAKRIKDVNPVSDTKVPAQVGKETGWKKEGSSPEEVSHEADGKVTKGKAADLKREEKSAGDKPKHPAAACQNCGGWTSYGGMSQHADGPKGCKCDGGSKAKKNELKINAEANGGLKKKGVDWNKHKKANGGQITKGKLSKVFENPAGVKPTGGLGAIGTAQSFKPKAAAPAKPAGVPAAAPAPKAPAAPAAPGAKKPGTP